MTHHNEATGLSGNRPIVLRSPAELADALPYLMGFHPDESVVLAATHGDEGALGGRVRLGLPESVEDWPETAEQLANCLIKSGVRRGAKPDAMVVYLCREPRDGQTGRQVMEYLRPLAEALGDACVAAGVPVSESLCLSGGRYWSYLCPDPRCCAPEGMPLSVAGTSVIAAAAAYAGLQVRGSIREMENRYTPLEGSASEAQERALDAAARMLVPRILEQETRAETADETVAAVGRALEQFRAAAPAAGRVMADIGDDTLLSERQAATLIIGLQDRTTRDRAAEWMEGQDGAAALRLWRSLARRCVGAYAEHAAAPLTLAGWVAWSLGDEIEARAVLCMALRRVPDYTFARLLHHAIIEGLDPESVRKCLRASGSSPQPMDGPPVEPEPDASGREPEQDDTETAATAGTSPGADPDSGVPATEGDSKPTPAPKPLVPRQRRATSRRAVNGPWGGDRTRRPRTTRSDVRSPGSRASGPVGRDRRSGTPGSRSRR
ncbi:hypothetical protein DSC45_30650 [Streptomyces sp. YIM 130001]|uniref:DUF4192 domain-containing protein n=1 Tax=Streptomyces sp. YIM 130001 TaxID=2259644 RepID=UPI000E65E0B9|nr:DUF4192 domain-containing protein [Streptomyces sp. YIM 130001]RII09441.1 hypothetical protein DSC45_30650 [Streptomyces sp. YIM 130001]